MELIVVVPFCCLGVFVLLGFGLVILMILRQSQPYSAQEMGQAEASASDFISRTVPTLRPWQPSALTELSCQWQGTRGGFTIGQYQGVVKSLSNPDGPSLLAYHLSLKGSRGFLRLHTSEREVRLDIEANQAHVTVQGRPLGSIHLHEGTILDSGGQPIGRYHRYRGLRWQVSSAPTSSRYGPLELHGRTVAEVNDGLVRSGGLLTGSAATRPLVRNLVPDLTPGEENWLLALVALELYHCGIRYRNRPRALHF